MPKPIKSGRFTKTFKTPKKSETQKKPKFKTIKPPKTTHLVF